MPSEITLINITPDWNCSTHFSVIIISQFDGDWQAMLVVALALDVPKQNNQPENLKSSLMCFGKMIATVKFL